MPTMIKVLFTRHWKYKYTWPLQHEDHLEFFLFSHVPQNQENHILCYTPNLPNFVTHLIYVMHCMYIAKLRNYSWLYFWKTSKIQVISIGKIRFYIINSFQKRVILHRLKTFSKRTNKALIFQIEGRMCLQ